MQSASIKGFGSYVSVQLGSQLKHAFVLTAKEKAGKQATAVSVFDTPLETLAGATLAKMMDKTNYANIHRLSVVKTWLISTHANALRTFMEGNPQITTVNLCLPNTDSGRKIAALGIAFGFGLMMSNAFVMQAKASTGFVSNSYSTTSPYGFVMMFRQRQVIFIVLPLSAFGRNAGVCGNTKQDMS